MPATLDNDKTGRRVSRRTVVKGSAWAAPAVVMATSLPAFATSPGKLEPGLNGWVRVAPSSCRRGTMSFDVTTPTDDNSKDFGLFVWNGGKDGSGNPVPVPIDKITNPTFIFWVSAGSVSLESGPGQGWSYAGTVQGTSGSTGYVGLKFTYQGDYTVEGDRVYMAPLNFSVSADFGRYCPRSFSTIAERHVTVAGEDLTFARILHYTNSGNGYSIDPAQPVSPILGSGPRMVVRSRAANPQSEGLENVAAPAAASI